MFSRGSSRQVTGACVLCLQPLSRRSRWPRASLNCSAAVAGVANAGVADAAASDPLAGIPWGNYTGRNDEVFPAYRQASGEDKRLLGLIALRPRVRWFGSWYPDSQAESTARDYIANATHGNPNALAQLAVFRLVPWEGAACHAIASTAQASSYKQWIDAFAAGIGSSRVALILQPDLPFEECVPHHSQLPLQLVAYAAQRFSALPHTSVYIDAGAGDWPTVRAATSMLLGAGIRYARGFALNATHYDSTEREIHFGAKVVGALAGHGVRGRHFVINTSSNGRGFTFQQYHGVELRQRRGVPEPRLAPLRHAGDPADHRRGQSALGAVPRRAHAGTAVRRRVPVDRTALARQPGRPVRSPALARAGAHHAVLKRA